MRYLVFGLFCLALIFASSAEGQGFRGYAETKFSADSATAAGLSVWLSADSDTVLTPWLTKECEWTVAEITAGAETGLDCLMVTYDTSIDSVTWTSVSGPTAIIAAGTSVVYFSPIARVATGTVRSQKWLRLTIRDASTGEAVTNIFKSLKVKLMRGCWADPHQVANW